MGRQRPRQPRALRTPLARVPPRWQSSRMQRGSVSTDNRYQQVAMAPSSFGNAPRPQWGVPCNAPSTPTPKNEVALQTFDRGLDVTRDSRSKMHASRRRSHQFRRFNGCSRVQQRITYPRLRFLGDRATGCTSERSPLLKVARTLPPISGDALNSREALSRL